MMSPKMAHSLLEKIGHRLVRSVMLDTKEELPDAICTLAAVQYEHAKMKGKKSWKYQDWLLVLEDLKKSPDTVAVWMTKLQSIPEPVEVVEKNSSLEEHFS